MSVKQIEKAITQLKPNQVGELMSWLADYNARIWDKQIEDDLYSGRLDAFLAKADRDYAAGKAKPL